MQNDPETQYDPQPEMPEDTAFDQFLAAALIASLKKDKPATTINFTPEMAAYLKQRSADLLAELKARFPEPAQ